MKARTSLWIVAALATLCPIASAGEASFQRLGFLSTSDYFSAATAISGNGSVVVGYSWPGRPEAFRWTATTGMVSLGSFTPGHPLPTSAHGVSYDGSVVVGDESVSGLAFRWTASGGMVSLTNTPNGIQPKWANDVTPDGSVVVGSYGEGGPSVKPYRWTATTGSVALKQPFNYDYTDARAVSDDGSVVVGHRHALTTEAFRWTPSSGLVGLGDLLGGHYSEAMNISGNGSVIVGQSTSGSGFEAFRWTVADGMVGLGDIPGGGFSDVAWAASYDGSIIVGAASSSAGGEAFIWDAANGMRSLQELLASFGVGSSGWRLTGATGISDDGCVITGVGNYETGPTEAWVAVIPGPGDATCDGTVDVRDLAVLAYNYNCGGMGWQQGDFTGDSTVDVHDLAILAFNYNGSTPPPAVDVPEPATLSLLAFGGLALIRRRRLAA